MKPLHNDVLCAVDLCWAKDNCTLTASLQYKLPYLPGHSTYTNFPFQQQWANSIRSLDSLNLLRSRSDHVSIEMCTQCKLSLDTSKQFQEVNSYWRNCEVLTMVYLSTSISHTSSFTVDWFEVGKGATCWLACCLLFVLSLFKLALSFFHWFVTDIISKKYLLSNCFYIHFYKSKYLGQYTCGPWWPYRLMRCQLPLTASGLTIAQVLIPVEACERVPSDSGSGGGFHLVLWLSPRLRCNLAKKKMIIKTPNSNTPGYNRPSNHLFQDHTLFSDFSAFIFPWMTCRSINIQYCTCRSICVSRLGYNHPSYHLCSYFAGRKWNNWTVCMLSELG